jgi:hypothetical protein
VFLIGDKGPWPFLWAKQGGVFSSSSSFSSSPLEHTSYQPCPCPSCSGDACYETPKLRAARNSSSRRATALRKLGRKSCRFPPFSMGPGSFWTLGAGAGPGWAAAPLQSNSRVSRNQVVPRAMIVSRRNQWDGLDGHNYEVHVKR